MQNKYKNCNFNLSCFNMYNIIIINLEKELLWQFYVLKSKDILIVTKKNISTKNNVIFLFYKTPHIVFISKFEEYGIFTGQWGAQCDLGYHTLIIVFPQNHQIVNTIFNIARNYWNNTETRSGISVPKLVWIKCQIQNNREKNSIFFLVNARTSSVYYQHKLFIHSYTSLC